MKSDEIHNPEVPSSTLGLATSGKVNPSKGFRVFTETFFYSPYPLVLGTVLGLVLGISSI